VLVDFKHAAGACLDWVQRQSQFVMDALAETVDSKGSYPFGLFWFCRGGQLRAEFESLLIVAERPASRTFARVELAIPATGSHSASARSSIFAA
jgi:hypothetical protein